MHWSENSYSGLNKRGSKQSDREDWMHMWSVAYVSKVSVKSRIWRFTNTSINQSNGRDIILLPILSPRCNCLSSIIIHSPCVTKKNCDWNSYLYWRSQLTTTASTFLLLEKTCRKKRKEKLMSTRPSSRNKLNVMMVNFISLHIFSLPFLFLFF